MSNLGDCIICLEDLECEIIQLDCNHYFHKDCIFKWLNNTKSCPICRAKINNNLINHKIIKKTKQKINNNLIKRNNTKGFTNEALQKVTQFNKNKFRIAGGKIIR